VNISFNKKKSETFANNDSKGIQKLGFKRFQLYKRRLDQTAAANSLEDLRYASGKYHELMGIEKARGLVL
jgi:plasmid maintenance system killer protein